MPTPGRLARTCFNLVHQHQLVYNTCWEDPRLDREALALGPRDTVVVITSAGCNALDYVLDEPRHVFAVDLNPRQNALLELKQAAIRALDYESFFEMFGRGRLDGWRKVYRTQLRPQLTWSSRGFWDRHPAYFTGSLLRPSLYFHGTTGLVARAVATYLNHVVRVRPDLDALLSASTVEMQREIYDRRLRGQLWRPFLKWLLGQDATLSLLAVPRSQREHLERDYPGGIAGFIEQNVETVMTRLPIADNYFWRVYLTGAYTHECCPEYLKRRNFERLKAGLADRITTYTSSVLSFLRMHPEPISRFVLLDHMDWLCDADISVLAAEWQQIINRAAPGAKALWRSGGTHTDFVDRLRVTLNGRRTSVGSVLRYQHEMAARLHAIDRVHTYGSFHIAEIAA